jgi:hypothetical protein
MNKGFTTLTVVAASLGSLLVVSSSRAQTERSTSAPEVIVAERYDVSRPLRDIPVVWPKDNEEEREGTNPPRRGSRPPAVGLDAAIRPSGAPDAFVNGLELNFDGQGATGVAPPDTNGVPGATQYVQWVNLQYNVYDKSTGALVGGPFPGTHFWAGFGGKCENENGGDPIMQWDKAAGRWVALQLAYNNGFTSNSICMAVSTTPDALGAYARYEFNFGSNLPDYPKMGVWPDGYYVTSNTFPPGAAKSCAMDRTKMLAGLPAPTAICFQLAASEWSLLPSDLDGLTPPPVGSPNYNIELGSATNLRMYKFHVDFAVPANSTFTGPTLLTVNSYSEFCFSNCVPQPGTGQRLDALGDRLMHRLPYRNFGTHESILGSHAIINAGVAAVRWYEIRGLSGTPSVFQQGTVAANNVYLWFPSIAQDKQGNIAVGFSAGNGAGVRPSLAVAGRLPGDPPGTMRTPHALVIGTGVQTGTSRWGDYAAMTIDPIDDCTLWFTGEYMKTSGSRSWSTRISSFTFPSCQ